MVTELPLQSWNFVVTSPLNWLSVSRPRLLSRRWVALSPYISPLPSRATPTIPPLVRVQVAAPPPGRAPSPSPGLLPIHTSVAYVVSALGNSGLGMNPGSLQPLPRGHLVGLFPVAHFSWAVPVFSDSQILKYFPWETQTPRCQKIQLANAS